MLVFTTHLWKEWREHRAVLLGILVAMPVLTAATFVGFASFGAQLANGAAVFTGGAAAMTALALSVELFAGEVTRRTLGFWRRQPGGLAVGGLAKVAMLLLAVSVATVWGGLCFWTACRTFVGAKAAETAWASLSTPEYALGIPFLSLVLASWILLTSTWVARGAAAVGIALLLLAAIGAPGAVLWGERTAYLKTLIPGVAVTALAGIAFPLAVAGLSLFVGRRRTDRPFRAALACFGLIVLGGGAAYAHANGKFERWIDVRLDDADARVTDIFVGKGGKVAFASLTRVGDDTVRRPLAIDLTTGVARPIGPTGTTAFAWSQTQRMYDGVRSGTGLVQRYSGFELDATKATMELLDGATASSLGTFPMAPLDGRALEIVRGHVRADTPVRTLDGRRAWAIRHLVPEPRGRSTDGSPIWAVDTWIERETAEGGVDRLVIPSVGDLHVLFGMRGGWRGTVGSRSVFIPADFKTVDDCLPYVLTDNRTGDKGTGDLRIDARRYLHRRFPRRREESYSWRVVDVVAQTDEPAPGFDPWDSLLRMDDGSALVWRRPQFDPTGVASLRRGGLARIDLTTGTRGPDAAFEGGDPTPVTWSDVSFLGVTPAGRWILNAIVAGDRGVVVYDPARHELSRYTSSPGANITSVAAIVDEDSIYVNEYEPRDDSSWGQVLTKVELGSGRRTRLFPR